MNKQLSNYKFLLNLKTIFLIMITSFSLSMIIPSCNEKKQDTLYGDILHNYGHESFENATIIHYRSRNLVYNIFRNGYKRKIEVTRKNKDSIIYKTIYEDGLITDYIDGKMQPQKEYTFNLVRSSIESSVFSSFIPHVFTANDFKVTRLEDQKFRNKVYSVLLAKTKFVEDIDIHSFYLYIDKKTNDIMFSSQDYNVESGKFILKKYFNHRTVDGIRFADYQPFVLKDPTMELSDLIKNFNALYFQPLKEVTYKEISVSY